MPDPNIAVLDFLGQRLSQPAKIFAPPVPDDAALTEILRIATRVPDHGKLEPWRLIVLKRPDFDHLANLAVARAEELGADAEKTEKARGQFDRGHLAVAVIASPKASEKIPEAEQLLSAGALCYNIVVTATAAGWGANWLSGWPAHDAIFRARAFGCSEVERVAGIVHIGTPSNRLGERPRPDLSKIVQWGLQDR